MSEINIEDLLNVARYGELDELISYLSETGQSEKPYFEWTVHKGHAGNTMLHMAAGNGHTDLIRWLVERVPAPTSESINVENDEGNTPLHWACMNGHANVVEVLMKAGGDVKRKNQSEHTPIYYAHLNEKYDVVNVILKLSPDEESDDDSDVELPPNVKIRIEDTTEENEIAR